MIRILTLLAALLGALAPVSAAPTAPSAPMVNVGSGGLAVQGYDAVAFFTERKPVKGSPAHQLQWNGATWRFASPQALAAFTADPARYAPQFGGYCAWAVSQHYLAPGDPNFWKIIDGKLYLNANARAKQLWEADQTSAIARGHANWPAVLTDNQDSGGR